MQNKLPILPIAIALGVVAIGGTALLLMKRPAADPVPVAGAATQVSAAPTPTPAPEMRYIANRDIPPRTAITSDMLRLSPVSGTKPAGAISSLDDVRGMITSKAIRSGDTITADSFIEPLGRAIPARFAIPSGFRAVAIYVNPQQTAAGLVDVGDRVDVIATQKITIDKQPNQFIIGTKDFTTGRTIGTNLLVLAVEESLDEPVVRPTPTPAPAAAAAPGAAPAAPAAGANLPADAAAPPAGGAAPADNAPPEVRKEGDGQPAGNIRVILAAPLEIASRLVAANADGTLHVLVRNPLDGDAEAAPETREYPSRTVTVKPPTVSGGGGMISNGGGSGGGNSSPAFPMPDLPPVTVSQKTETTPPMPMPVPINTNANASGGSTNMSAPPEPATRDVMVVRGTEKTRVIVPKR